jgi:hypothetical protein
MKGIDLIAEKLKLDIFNWTTSGSQTACINIKFL